MQGLAYNSAAIVEKQKSQANAEESYQTPLNHTGLPDRLKTGMENLSGMNLDKVKVHYNSPHPATIQAHAFARGNDIHLASGQEQHLPHELGHVVQQMQGRVPVNSVVSGMKANNDASLEREADSMAAKALQSRPNTLLQSPAFNQCEGDQSAQYQQPATVSQRNAVIQGMFWEETPEGRMIFHYGPVINRWWRSANRSYKGNGWFSWGVYKRKSHDPVRQQQQQRFDGLPDNQRWKEYVDLKHHGFQPDVYDTGAHHADKPDQVRAMYTEPGFTQAIQNARALIHNGLGQHLDTTQYEAINAAAIRHLMQAGKKTGWRGETDNLTTGVPGWSDQVKNDTPYNLALEEAQDFEGPRNRHRAEIHVRQQQDGSGDIAFFNRPTEEIQALTKTILDEYYTGIGAARTADQKLLQIAKTHQQLERLHPFMDANTRTNLLILNKLLTEQGFHPVIMEEPNAAYLVSAEQWRQKIREGLDRWQALKEQ